MLSSPFPIFKSQLFDFSILNNTDSKYFLCNKELLVLSSFTRFFTFPLVYYEETRTTDTICPSLFALVLDPELSIASDFLVLLFQVSPVILIDEACLLTDSCLVQIQDVHQVSCVQNLGFGMVIGFWMDHSTDELMVECAVRRAWIEAQCMT